MKTFYRFAYGGYDLALGPSHEGGLNPVGGSERSEVSETSAASLSEGTATQPTDRLQKYLAYKARMVADNKVSLGVLTEDKGTTKTKRLGFAHVVGKGIREYDSAIYEGAIARPRGNLYYQSLPGAHPVPFVKEVCSRSAVIIDIDGDTLLSFTELCPTQLASFNKNEAYSAEVRGFVSNLVQLAQPYLSLALGDAERVRREREVYEKNRLAREAEAKKQEAARLAYLETREGLEAALKVVSQRITDLPKLKEALELEEKNYKEKLNTLAQKTEEV